MDMQFHCVIVKDSVEEETFFFFIQHLTDPVFIPISQVTEVEIVTEYDIDHQCVFCCSTANRSSFSLNLLILADNLEKVCGDFAWQKSFKGILFPKIEII